MFKRIIVVRGNTNSQSANQESHPLHVKDGNYGFFDLFFTLKEGNLSQVSCYMQNNFQSWKNFSQVERTSLKLKEVLPNLTKRLAIRFLRTTADPKLGPWLLCPIYIFQITILTRKLAIPYLEFRSSWLSKWIIINDVNTKEIHDFKLRIESNFSVWSSLMRATWVLASKARTILATT